MKTAAVVLGLVCLVAAGPVERTGEDVCVTQCRPGSKLNFIPGKSYSYKYETKTETALEQTSDEKSSIYMTADVSLHVIDPCRFALKVDSIVLEEEGAGRGRQPSAGNDELKAALMKRPLMFNYEDGKVNRICPSTEETVTALNIKRAIISMMQNSMDRLDRDETIEEEDVTGECKTEYTVSKGWGAKLISKRKVLSKCRSHGFQQTALLAMPKNIARSSSIVNGTQECQQNIKDKVIQSVECTERHVVRPFSHQDKGATAVITQKLNLKTTGQADKGASAVYRKWMDETLKFDRKFDIEQRQQEFVQNAKQAIEKLAQLEETSTRKATGEFSDLVDYLRKTNYNNLKGLFQGMQGRNSKVMLDALMSTYTLDAMKLTAELIKQGTINDKEAKMWMVNAALVKNVKAEIVRDFLPLLEKNQMEAYLAISALARTVIEENNFNGDYSRVIHELISYLYNHLNDQTEKPNTLAVLKAIGNLGVPYNGKEEIIYRIAQNKNFRTEVRVAAAEAFRRFSCDIRREELFDIFTDMSNDAEVRIGAYLNSIICPTEEMIHKVRNTLLKESEEKQVASFVYTHIKNLAQRSTWNYDLTPITTEKTLEKFDLEGRQFSKNYFYEMFFDPLDAGFEVDSGIIYGETANRFLLNTTLDVFGHRVNFFDAGFRMNNNMKNFATHLRFFGKEIFYQAVDFNKQNHEFEWILKAIQSPNGLNFKRSMLILDTEMVIPTGNGLPLTIAVNGTTTMNIDVKAHSTKSHEMNLLTDIRASPKTAVRFGVSMIVRAPRTEAGVRLVTVASSQWSIDGQLKVDLKAPRMVKMNIGVPQERSDLLNIESNVYLVSSGRQQELESGDARTHKHSFCSGSTTHKLIGHKVCVEAMVPISTGNDTPFFLLRGASRVNIHMLKTDKTLKNFHFESSLIHERGSKDEFMFRIDTPESQIDRQMKVRVYHDLKANKLGVELVTPIKKAELEGSYTLGSEKKMQIDAKVDGIPKMRMIGSMKAVNGRTQIYTPIFEVLIGRELNEKVVAVKSEISYQGAQKTTIDLDVETRYTNPIRVRGELAVAGNNRRRANLEIDSELIKTTLRSTVSYGEKNLALDFDGNYQYKQGKRRSVGFNGKLTENQGVYSAETKLRLDEEPIIGAAARYIVSPRSADIKAEYFGKKYNAKITHEKKANTHKVLLISDLEGKEYRADMRVNAAEKPMVFFRITLPDGTSKQIIKAQLTRKDNFGEVMFLTDIIRPISGKAGFSMDKDTQMYSANGQFKVDDRHFTADLSVKTKGVYEGQIHIRKDDQQMLLAHVQLAQDLYRPMISATVNYNMRDILDAKLEGQITKNQIQAIVGIKAPKKIRSSITLVRSGSVKDGLTLRFDGELNGAGLDMEVSNTNEIVLFGSAKKINVDGTLKFRKQEWNLKLNNDMDKNTYNLDWQMKTPEFNHKVRTTGTYRVEDRKASLRGTFEMDVALRGKRHTVDETVVEVEALRNREEMKLKAELNRKNMVLMGLNLKGLMGAERMEAVAEARWRNKVYSAEWNLTGRRIESGITSMLKIRYDNADYVHAQGELQFNEELGIFKVEMQTPFKKFNNAKFAIRREGQRQKETIKAEMTIDRHFAKAEIMAARTEEAITLKMEGSSSHKEYSNMKITALFRTKQHDAGLDMEIHVPRFENNRLSLRVQKDSEERFIVAGRATIPTIYQGELFVFDGKLEGRETMNGKVNVMYRGSEKILVNVYTVNQKDNKKVTIVFSHGFRGVKEEIQMNAEYQKPSHQAHDVKIWLMKDTQKLVDFHHFVSYDIKNEKYVENMIEAQTTLLREWNSLYLKNMVRFNGQRLESVQEFGYKQNEILGSLKLDLHHMKSANSVNADVQGIWREKKIHMTTQAKYVHMRNLLVDASIQTEKGLVVVAKVEMKKEGKLVSAEGNLRLPKYNKETGLKMKIGQQQDAYIVEIINDRNNVPSKRTELMMRVPFKDVIDGSLKIKLPEELYHGAIVGNVLLKDGLLDADLKLSKDKKSFSAQTNFKWTQMKHLKLTLKQNEKVFASYEVTAEKKGTKYDMSAEFVYRDQTYNTKATAQLTKKYAMIDLEAGSNQWDKKHFIKGEASMETRTAKLEVEIAHLKAELNGQFRGAYKLRSMATYKNQNIEMEVSFNPENVMGEATLNVNKNKFDLKTIARLEDGHIHINAPNKKIITSWTLINKRVKVDTDAKIEGRQYNAEIQGTLDEKISLNFHLKTPSVRKEMKVDFKPAFSGEAMVVIKSEDAEKLNIKGEWTITKENASLKGHWVWNNNGWNVDFTFVPKTTGQFTGLVNHKGQRIGSFEFTWTLFRHFAAEGQFADFLGEKHTFKGTVEILADGINVDFAAHCPWVAAYPIAIKTHARITPTEFFFEGHYTFEKQVHTVKVNATLTDRRITGSINIDSPIYGKVRGSIEGEWTYQPGHIEFNARIRDLPFTGLQKADIQGRFYYKNQFGLEVNVNTNEQYHVKAVFAPFSSLVLDINVPYVRQTGFTITRSGDNSRFVIEAHYFGRKIIDGKWEVQGAAYIAGTIEAHVNFGERYGTHDIQVVYDFGTKHIVKVTVDGIPIIDFGVMRQENGLRLAKLVIPRIELDAQIQYNIRAEKMEMDAVLSSKYVKSMTLKMVRSMKQGEVHHDMKLTFTTTEQEQPRTLGYRLVLKSNTPLDSKVEIFFPTRTVALRMNGGVADGVHRMGFVFAWDAEKNQNKRIEIVFGQKKSQETRIVETTIEMPHLNKRMYQKFVAERRSSNEIHISHEMTYNQEKIFVYSGVLRMESQHKELRITANIPSMQWEMNYRALIEATRDGAKVHIEAGKKTYIVRYYHDEDRLEVTVDHQGHKDLISFNKKDRRAVIRIHDIRTVVEGRISPLETRLVFSRDGHDDVEFGYMLTRNTLRARAHWRPQMVADIKRAAIHMTHELKGDYQQKSQSQKYEQVIRMITREAAEIVKGLQKELREIQRELQVVINYVVKGFDRDTLYMRTTVEKMAQLHQPIRRFLKKISESVRNANERMTRQWEPIMEKSYKMAQKVQETMTRHSEKMSKVMNVNEIYEKVARKTREIRDNLKEKMHETRFGSMVEKFAPRYETVQRIVKENLCEISQGRTELRNIHCGMAYQFEPRQGDMSVLIRAPFVH